MLCEYACTKTNFLVAMTGFVEVCTCPAYTEQKILCARLGSDRFRFWLREVISMTLFTKHVGKRLQELLFVYELLHGFRQLLES
ncbi:hypothetical protein ACNJYA_08550 [Bradyrhizobium sp. DASA03068]|uniref:hypothetical protein n=1 Tax=Bradyrhizobium sp. BLXBL-01 TaxID=3395915 RepID=UPI003F6FE8AE